MQSGWEKGRSPQGHFFGAAPRLPRSQTAFRTNGFGFSCIRGITPKANFVVARDIDTLGCSAELVESRDLNSALALSRS